MPTDVALVDLADAIVADLSAPAALPSAVQVERRFDPTVTLKELEALTVPLVTVIPRAEADDIDARQAWQEAREIDIAVRIKLKGSTDNAVDTQVVAGLKLLNAIGRFYRLKRPTGRTETQTQVTYVTPWSPSHRTNERLYFGVVRLGFVNDVEEEDE